MLATIIVLSQKIHFASHVPNLTDPISPPQNHTLINKGIQMMLNLKKGSFKLTRDKSRVICAACEVVSISQFVCCLDCYCLVLRLDGTTKHDSTQPLDSTEICLF